MIKSVVRLLTVLTCVTYVTAITYMVRPEIHNESIGVFSIYALGIACAFLLANGSIDKYIVRFVKTEEDRTQLVRAGIGGFLFSLAFICVLLYRV